ncbi:MAG: beta-mannosidase [Alphaproteobacteria bacterium PA2]|nr:MAG: beta-mannosidase [Alphaproteobacteria bacterium PA2]
MARINSMTGQTRSPLSEGWTLALTEAGACPDPSAASRRVDWIPARAPGTTAGALRDAGRSFDRLTEQDVWWRRDVDLSGPGSLRFEGLAGLAEVWLDGKLVLTSTSMFLAHEVELPPEGVKTLWLAFRAMAPHLERKLPRARWRPRMIDHQGLRGVRTSLIGHVPGWSPVFETIGPWRPIVALGRPTLRIENLDIKTGYDGGRAWISAEIAGVDISSAPVLVCDERRLALTSMGAGRYAGRMALSGVRPWWPHTHGDQPLYPVKLQVGDTILDLVRTGFRDIAVDRGEDGQGFQLRINGVPVFARGAVWTSSDPVGRSCDRDHYAPLIARAKAAGMNMLRLSGTGAYEGRAFHDLCDELGILVWQDFMFANFDYPASDPDFAREVDLELAQVLSDRQLSPSLAVICGGSEVHQQAAMMGLREENYASHLFDEIMPRAAALWRPDVPFVPNSPSGGALPFVVDSGVGHYYGVGAYLRPLEDARRANVRFASECLAFANLPDGPVTDRGLGVPRDLGADWDFADVRDYYLGRLYGEDPAGLLARDPVLYADLCNAAVSEIMEATFAEWRRPASACGGGLVWTFQDLEPGAGWGVLDCNGRPKAVWYALKRAFRPIQLTLTDEGVNGLAVHVLNETNRSRTLVLEFTCLRDGATPVLSVTHDIEAPAHSGQTLSAFALIGRFFDLTYAYRFGPPGHDVSIARLRGEDGEVLAEAFHFPGERLRTPDDVQLTASLDGHVLRLASQKFLPSLRVEAPGFEPSDNGFHLAPGIEKVVRLTGPGNRVPAGRVLAPGGRIVAEF